MGNRNANEQNNNGFNEQILPQNAGNAQMRDPPSVKKVFAVRNPINIKKQTLSLEKNISSPNQYYLKFNYDALVNFNCYINFHVSKNSIFSPFGMFFKVILFEAILVDGI